MSGNSVPPVGEPAGPVLPAAGWYPDPETWVGLRWWDGAAWASVASWPAAAPLPAPPGRVSAWLASPVASPVLAVVAAVTAIGWAGAAVVMAAAAAAAHPVLPALTVDLSGFVLSVADIAVWIGVRACRAGGARSARPAGMARAMRRAAQRARQTSSGPSVVLQAARRLVRRHRRAFASLPRAVAWSFAAAIWSTVGACLWVIFELVALGWYWAGDLGATAAGQQLAAIAWMIHLIAWSGTACRRLDRTRAAARMMPVVSVGSR
jgi:Protein of unknown function (DUF2510)